MSNSTSALVQARFLWRQLRLCRGALERSGIQEISLEMVPSIEEEWESRESTVKH